MGKALTGSEPLKRGWIVNMEAFLESFWVWIWKRWGKFCADAADFVSHAAAVLFHVAVFIAFGALVALGRMSRFKPLQWLIRAYLLVMRGTPLMLQLIFFWFGLKLGKYGFSRMETAIVAFVLNYAAYFAEIYRAGSRGAARPAGSR